MQKPLVSIIIPSFNSEKYIALAIESVLKQTYRNCEIIVIDDGSSDSSFKIASEYARRGQIKILHHSNFENKGVSKTRHLGIMEATGEYIAFLDSDDFFEEDKIEKQIVALESNRNYILCHTAIKPISETAAQADFVGHFNISEDVLAYNYQECEDFLLSNHVCNSSVMVRSSILKQINFCSRQIFQYEDWVLWVLLSEHGKFLYLPDELLNYRFHENSATYKVVSNRLINHYSSLEFCLMLIAKTNNKDIALKALQLSKKQILEICKIYGNGKTCQFDSFFENTEEKERQLNELLCSYSWKITAPLRGILDVITKRGRD